jgi:putative effector of murein hydrolase LrgA (UPF0299 family)
LTNRKSSGIALCGGGIIVFICLSLHGSINGIILMFNLLLANRIRKESSLGSKARCIELVSGVRLKEVRVI